MEPVPVRCRIPEILKSRGQSQQWLSEKTGLSKQRISDYVQLRYIMRLPTAILISKKLRVQVEDLHVWDWQQE